jgi:peptidoglycan hydrolase CwlO-like protein
MKTKILFFICVAAIGCLTATIAFTQQNVPAVMNLKQAPAQVPSMPIPAPPSIPPIPLITNDSPLYEIINQQADLITLLKKDKQNLQKQNEQLKAELDACRKGIKP